jgi:hypothetical protein
MAWVYDVKIEGVPVDIEYTEDRDIETGAAALEVEQVQIGGVNAGPLLYAIHQGEATKLIDAALAAALKDDESKAKQARRARLLNSAMCGDMMEELNRLRVCL